MCNYKETRKLAQVSVVMRVKLRVWGVNHGEASHSLYISREETIIKFIYIFIHFYFSYAFILSVLPFFCVYIPSMTNYVSVR